jgi:hypothetical protein
MPINPSIKKLFDACEKAFSTLNIENQVPFFADHFISEGTKGSIAQNRDEFEKSARQAAEYYSKIGQTEAKILSMKETEISKEYSMVKVHWGVKFKKTGEKWIEFDITYLIQRTDAEPKIIMFISHQDEEKAMQELGIN